MSVIKTTPAKNDIPVVQNRKGERSVQGGCLGFIQEEKIQNDIKEASRSIFSKDMA